MRLLHLSDIHFGAHDTAALEALERFLDDHPCDATVISGDLTQSGRRHEFDQAASWLPSLPLPLVIAPGNHDIPARNLIARFSRPFKRFERLQAHAQMSVITALASIHTLRTTQAVQARLNWSHGAISRRNLDALITAVSSTEPTPWRILACHHPLIDYPDQPVQGNTHRAAMTLERLTSAGVNLVLYGHVHQPRIDVFPIPAARLVLVGCGTLSSRTRKVPASFHLLDLKPDRVTVSTQVYNGAAFATAGRREIQRPAVS